MLRALRLTTAQRTNRHIKYLQSPGVASEIELETVGAKPASFALASEVEFVVSSSTATKVTLGVYPYDVTVRLP
jgi:hypothetical protein